ncbi:hypothetical protein JXA02_01140 [candidate division KSB1 bacterium]|nr:hypothetical protein [candidate division KSB1 bacterium]RQW11056.1 MAG: hypothetical protein EH222_01215 [candidate division KSB1 bacterium]
MNFEIDIESSNGNISPQLPSFVDIVFILLIFFLVLSVIGVGFIETGRFAEDRFEKEQELSDFPRVYKALRLDLPDFLILAMEMDKQGKEKYFVFSNAQYQSVTVKDAAEYEAVRAKIAEGGTVFSGVARTESLEILQSTWGPFASVEDMMDSRLIRLATSTNLVIQATEDFTYHKILQILRAFSRFKSVYFEVIESAAI